VNIQWLYRCYRPLSLRPPFGCIRPMWKTDCWFDIQSRYWNFHCFVYDAAEKKVSPQTSLSRQSSRSSQAHWHVVYVDPGPGLMTTFDPFARTVTHGPIGLSNGPGPQSSSSGPPERLTCFFLRHHKQNSENSNSGIEYRINSQFST